MGVFYLINSDTYFLGKSSHGLQTKVVSETSLNILTYLLMVSSNGS